MIHDRRHHEEPKMRYNPVAVITEMSVLQWPHQLTLVRHDEESV